MEATDSLNECSECGKPTYRDPEFSICVSCISKAVDKLLECKRTHVQSEISVVEALKFLILLKEEKVKYGETEFYKTNKEVAWENARKALASTEPVSVSLEKCTRAFNEIYEQWDGECLRGEEVNIITKSILDAAGVKYV